MIAEFGLAALWLAMALALLQLFAGSLALTPQGQALGGVVRPVAVVQGVLALAATPPDLARLVIALVATTLNSKSSRSSGEAQTPTSSAVRPMASAWLQPLMRSKAQP